MKGPSDNILQKKNLEKLIWPLIALAGILIFNFIFTKGFFKIEYDEVSQRLTGSLIDILNRGTLLTGGSGFMEGTMFGVLIYGVILKILNFLGISAWWLRILIGILLFIFILLQTYLARTAKLKK